jgi:predicted nucleic-acid-binding Zn-ribbon protein
MHAQNSICPKCGGEMRVGFVVDMSDSGRLVPKWIAGEPETPFWSFGAKISDKEQHPVQTFRCSMCGYLESYARAVKRHTG